MGGAARAGWREGARGGREEGEKKKKKKKKKLGPSALVPALPCPARPPLHPLHPSTHSTHPTRRHGAARRPSDIAAPPGCRVGGERFGRARIWPSWAGVRGGGRHAPSLGTAAPPGGRGSSRANVIPIAGWIICVRSEIKEACRPALRAKEPSSSAAPQLLHPGRPRYIDSTLVCAMFVSSIHINVPPPGPASARRP